MAQLMSRRLKRFTAIVATILLVVMLTGCDVKRLRVKQIKRDFIAEHYWAYPLRNYFGKFPITDMKNVEIDKFKIMTRLKTEETDEMVFDVSATDPENKIKVTGEYSITYILAGDEWMLKSFTVLSEKILPLQASSFSDDEILLAIKFCGYDDIIHAQVSGRATDLKNGKDSYRISAKNTAGEQLNFALSFDFSPENNGWSVLKAECKKI